MEQKTIDELLEQTRPVMKGNRVRGKSSKRRGRKKSSSEGNGNREAGYAVESLARMGLLQAGLAAQQAQSAAQAEAEAQYLNSACYQQQAQAQAAFGGGLSSQARIAGGVLGGLGQW